MSIMSMLCKSQQLWEIQCAAFFFSQTEKYCDLGHTKSITFLIKNKPFQSLVLGGLVH